MKQPRPVGRDEELDELVHELKAREAAQINNGGVDAQLAYLRSSGMDSDAVSAELGVPVKFTEVAGGNEPLIVTEPLSAAEFRRHIAEDGRARLALPVSLDEIYDCRGIDGFNDLVDSRLYGEGVRGCLTDIMYRPLRIMEDERVLIDIIARTDELELEESA